MNQENKIAIILGGDGGKSLQTQVKISALCAGRQKIHSVLDGVSKSSEGFLAWIRFQESRQVQCAIQYMRSLGARHVDTVGSDSCLIFCHPVKGYALYSPSSGQFYTNNSQLCVTWVPGYYKLPGEIDSDQQVLGICTTCEKENEMVVIFIDMFFGQKDLLLNGRRYRTFTLPVDYKTRKDIVIMERLR